MRNTVSLSAVLVCALITGCSSLPTPKPYVPTPKAKVLAVAPGAAPPASVPDDEITNRIAFVAEKQNEYTAASKHVHKVLRQQLRDANNNRGFILGTGGLGIACGVAVSALAAASPGANIVWITALSGIGAGALAFQTQAALQGITVQAVANARQTYMTNVVQAEISVNISMVKLAGAVYSTSLPDWNTAATETDNNLSLLNMAAEEPIPGAQAALQNSETIVFTTQPGFLIVPHGQNGGFTATASTSLANAISYQWQISTDHGVSWQPLTDGGVSSGSATGGLKLTAVTPAMNLYEYRCVATDAATKNAATSMKAVLIVN